MSNFKKNLNKIVYSWVVASLIWNIFFSLPTIYNQSVWLINFSKMLIANPSLSTAALGIKSYDNSEVKKNIFTTLDCSNLIDQWRPGENTYFDDQSKIKLKNGKSAGTIFLKDKISSFLTFEIKFRSSLTTGINTSILFQNDDGELKYSIGDGDFRIIRYSYSRKGEVHNERTVLSSEIDNNEDLGFKLDIIERGSNNEAIGSLVYKDVDGYSQSIDLINMTIEDPQELFLVIGFGFDANKEENKEDAYIEIISCNITESSPSKILDN